MRSAAKLNYAQAQAAIDGRPDDTTGPLLDPILKPLYARLCAASSARATNAIRSISTCPERKILLKTRRYRRSRHRAGTARCA